MYGVASHVVSARLSENWKLSEEFGLSNDVQELLGPFVVPEKNAAIPIDEAALRAKRMFASVQTKHKLTIQTIDFDNPTYQAEFDALRTDSEYERLMNEADRATGYRSPVALREPLNNTLLDHVQDRRWVVRAERMINQRLISQGKREEAVRRILRHLRILRKWEDREPFSMSLLANIAIRGVAFADLNSALRSQSPLPVSLHDEIETELQRQEELNRCLPFVFQWDKISQVELVDESFKQRLRIGRPIYDQQKAMMLRNAHAMMSAWDEPFAEFARVYDELERADKAEAQSPLRRLISPTATIPTARMTHRAVFRTQARARCLRVVNAWAKRGDFSLDLDELVLPNECLTDPYDGNRLRVKRGAGGPTIYSISDDLVDDGGRIQNFPGDQGYGPPGEEKK